MAMRQLLFISIGGVAAMGSIPSDTTTCPARTPVIVDTDVDTDDMMALTYLLQVPDIEVKLISVAISGWSTPTAALANVLRITQMLGQGTIPVAYGTSTQT